MNMKRLLCIGAAHLFGGALQGARALPVGPEKGTVVGMVLVPAGPFWMGLDELPPDTPWGQEDARPKHQVTLPAFYIDRYEVTFGDYQKIDPSVRIPGRTAGFPVTG